MSKTIRIRATTDGDEKYVKIKLEQDFDLLEILSLKISQEDAYSNFCSNYGVVAGRVSVNDGYGIPNAKVSIFVPISDNELENNIISEIYPYQVPSDNNRNGLRYNLLPKQKQHTDHTPVGSFPEKREVLDDETFIEVYDKFYKYTTRTNDAGDYMLFGVPVGQHQLFYDVDVSDIGFLSARPFELIAQGVPESSFQDKFTFKGGTDLDELVQIKSSAISLLVKPFWCDTLNLGREIGITREDIPLKGYTLQPTSIFMGGLFSDDEKDSLNKDCRPRKKMGQMNELITGEGKMEIIRRTQSGDIEFYRDLGDDLIDENGNWSFQVPMNLRKVITAEDGTLIPSPDGVKGVASEADVRFRISMDKTNDDKKLRTRAKMLVPNMTGNYEFADFERDELREAENNSDPIFKINNDTSLTTGALLTDPANEYNRLEEFFTFRWKKVYTVRQYIGRFQPNNNDENRNFIGIKDIADGFGVNKMPFNRIDTNVNALYTILCFLLTMVGTIIALVNSLINIINGLITMICQIPIPCGISITLTSNKGSRQRYQLQGMAWDDFLGNYYPMKNNGDPDTSGPAGAFSTESGKYVYKGYENHWTNCVDVANRVTPTDTDEAGKCNTLTYSDVPKTLHGTPPNAPPSIIYDLFTSWSSSSAGGVQVDTQQAAHDWWYSHGSCISIGGNGNCKVLRLGDGPLGPYYAGDTDCDKCDLGSGCDGGCVKILGQCLCIKIKVKCILGRLLCKSCGASDVNDPDHGCCGPGNHNDNCSAECTDAGGDPDEPGSNQCCSDCCVKIPLIQLSCPEGSSDGPFTPTLIPVIFGGASCNKGQVVPCPTCGGLDLSPIDDWVKCRLEKIAVILGLIKFDFYNDWINGSLYFPLIKRKYKTKQRKKKFGQIKKDKFCDFDCYDGDVYNQYLMDTTQDNVPSTEINNRKFDRDHGKPLYISVEENGFTQFVNIRGHAHHQNKCNESFLIDRKEFTKKNMDCYVGSNGNPSVDQNTANNYDIDTNNLTKCQEGTCLQGTKACSAFCVCKKEESGYNGDKFSIDHGIIKWVKGVIYYASIIPNESNSSWNGNKVNDNNDGPFTKTAMMFPTNITELGSSAFCDIDDQPFIIDKLEPTTFKISEQPGGNSNTINVTTYADIGCNATKCINPKNVVMSSQIGIDILDVTDQGRELGTCESLFDHDDETREYFCKRFDTFINPDLDVMYNQPYNSLRENEYFTYPAILDGSPSLNNFGPLSADTLNDEDGIIPGDRCKLKGGKYIYGVDHRTQTLHDHPDTLTGIDGVSFHTTQTPYYFYFGLVPGKTALHKTVGKFFADKISEETLQGIDDQNETPPTQPGGTPVSPGSLLATCLSKS